MGWKEGLIVGCCEGDFDVGGKDGMFVGVSVVGMRVGGRVGFFVGSAVGLVVGIVEGELVVGEGLLPVGTIVGISVESRVG